MIGFGKYCIVTLPNFQVFDLFFFFPNKFESSTLDSSSSVDAVTDRGWRDDDFAAEYYSSRTYEPSKNALLVSDRALFFSPRSKLLTSAPPS